MDVVSYGIFIKNQKVFPFYVLKERRPYSFTCVSRSVSLIFTEDFQNSLVFVIGEFFVLIIHFIQTFIWILSDLNYKNYPKSFDNLFVSPLSLYVELYSYINTLNFGIITVPLRLLYNVVSLCHYGFNWKSFSFYVQYKRKWTYFFWHLPCVLCYFH